MFFSNVFDYIFLGSFWAIFDRPLPKLAAKVHQKSELRKVLQINLLRKIYFLIRLD